MKYIIFACILCIFLSLDLFLVVIVNCKLFCPLGQTYMRFLKRSGDLEASDEIFQIYQGSTLLYRDSGVTNNEVRISEQCFASSANDQYQVELFGSNGNSWHSGSSLTIYGMYGNAVFKSFLADSGKNITSVSLYYGIKQDSTWKMTTSFDSISFFWAEYSYNDSAWLDATLDSVHSAVSGTQYFRKRFVGLLDMAAYDVRLKYKAGVIAYINGVEVYRDNLPEGDVTPTTMALGEYQSAAYRGFIRPGFEVASLQSILAVEVHFTEATQTAVDFNAYLAILAASDSESNCFFYAEPITVSSNEQSKNSGGQEFSRMSYFHLDSSNSPFSVYFSFSGPTPFINSVRKWSIFPLSASLETFVWQGSYDSKAWNDVISAAGTVYNSHSSKQYFGYDTSALYKHYRMNIIGRKGESEVYPSEFQPLICSSSVPSSISFTPNSYKFLARYQEVHVRPDITQFTSCTAHNLPEGLTMDFTTCEIHGFANSAISDVPVTVMSVMNGQTYSGSFTLNIEECQGTVLNVLRVYGRNSEFETFEIKEVSSQLTVMAVEYNSGQIDNQEWSHTICVTGSKYEVTVGCILNWWGPDSVLYIRAVLSDNQMETILRLKYNPQVGFATTRIFNAHYSISTHSNWYYKMGEIPADWYASTSTEGWTEGNESSFPSSTNQIQLFKRVFMVSDIYGIAGFVLSIKYKYGCIVYLNGHEAFREGISDASISTSSYSSSTFADVLYHQISLPIKTLPLGTEDAYYYIQQGANTIAIGLVAEANDQTSVYFDCALRLMGEESVSRVFDYSVSYSSIDEGALCSFDHDNRCLVSKSSCDSNWLSISFGSYRHEWINSVTIKLFILQSSRTPSRFVLKARSGNDEWSTITTVSGLTWYISGQAQTVYFLNNKAYSEYRFENIAADPSVNCAWEFNTLDMSSVCTTRAIPELVYDDITLFRGYEMANVFPNSQYYFNFQISPSLPNGIFLDHNTGMIHGTSTDLYSAITYTITASKLTGETSSAAFSLSVTTCSGSRSMITLMGNTDMNSFTVAYNLYEGTNGTNGRVVSFMDDFYIGSKVSYRYFCLDPGIYTLQFIAVAAGLGDSSAMYYLTVDDGSMAFELGHFAFSQRYITTMFSAYLPFQIDSTLWKVNYEYVDGWNVLNFNDLAWVSKKGNEIGANGKVTTYFRKEVDIPDISLYHVLNIRIKYAGGIVAYFNGKKVARFNLEQEFDSNTMAIENHNPEDCSKFHIILNSVGAVTGRNLIAFEVHRYRLHAPSLSVVFDATGVFGVNECSVVLDTYSSIVGSQLDESTLKLLLDIDPTSYSIHSNVEGTYLEWTVENLEGSKFNSFAFLSYYIAYGYAFSLYARNNPVDTYSPLLELDDLAVYRYHRQSWSIPLGTIGYRQLRFEGSEAEFSSVDVSYYLLQYCKPLITCPGIGDFPSVGEGEISYGKCEEGYKGFSFRKCSNGLLREIDSQYCIQLKPMNLTYEQSEYNLTLGVAVSIPPPKYVNVIEYFYLGYESHLPLGLELNSLTGEITGTPTVDNGKLTSKIYGKNKVDSVSFTLTFYLSRGRCEDDGIFPATYVNEVAIVECSTQDPYFGTIRRTCVLGETGGVWQESQRNCKSIILTLFYVAVVVVVCVFVVVYVLLSFKKKIIIAIIEVITIVEILLKTNVESHRERSM